jgi:hypothetical protein
MIRADGPAREYHLCFVRRPAAFYVIAPKARADQIFPRILAPSAFRHDMIDGQCHARSTAILTSMTIPPEDILSRENYFLKWHPNIRRKPDHARKWHGNRSRTHGAACHARHEFRFFKIKQNDRFFDIRDRKRLIIAVQNEDFPAKLRVRGAEIMIILEEIGCASQRRRIR